MKYREFKLSEEGKLMFRFFSKLSEDKHFNENAPMTDTYVREVCFEARFNKEQTLKVMDELRNMNCYDVFNHTGNSNVNCQWGSTKINV